jgi:hypothetical protein
MRKVKRNMREDVMLQFKGMNMSLAVVKVYQNPQFRFLPLLCFVKMNL